jgi:holo-[acyl-carrier protein] synthase
MVLGLGIDLVEVARIEQALDRFGDRFAERVLHPEELAYCRSQKRPGPFIAARFAAKEAVSKAIGTGIGSELGWQDIIVRRLPSGAPAVELLGKGRALMKSLGASRIHLSLTHTDGHAAAAAVMESGAVSP